MDTRLEVHEDVAWLQVDDGKVNALSEGLLREIAARLDEAAPAARATALLGRPGIFSAGFDLATFARGADAAAGMLLAGVELLRKMLSHPHPIVTGCAGHAYPMGAFVMLSADVRFGVPGPFRIGMNEVAIGLTVPRFALALAEHRLTATGYARVGTGRMCSPEEAVRIGYLDELAPADQLRDAVAAVAREVRSVDATAYRQTKTRMHGALLSKLERFGRRDAIEEELEASRASVGRS